LILFSTIWWVIQDQKIYCDKTKKKTLNLVCHVPEGHSHEIGGHIKESQRKLRFKRERERERERGEEGGFKK